MCAVSFSWPSVLASPHPTPPPEPGLLEQLCGPGAHLCPSLPLPACFIPFGICRGWPSMMVGQEFLFLLLVGLPIGPCLH